MSSRDGELNKIVIITENKTSLNPKWPIFSEEACAIYDAAEVYKWNIYTNNIIYTDSVSVTKALSNTMGRRKQNISTISTELSNLNKDVTTAWMPFQRDVTEIADLSTKETYKRYQELTYYLKINVNDK